MAKSLLNLFVISALALTIGACDDSSSTIESLEESGLDDTSNAPGDGEAGDGNEEGTEGDNSGNGTVDTVFDDVFITIQSATAVLKVEDEVEDEDNKFTIDLDPPQTFSLLTLDDEVVNGLLDLETGDYSQLTLTLVSDDEADNVVIIGEEEIPLVTRGKSIKVTGGFTVDVDGLTDFSLNLEGAVTEKEKAGELEYSLSPNLKILRE